MNMIMQPTLAATGVLSTIASCDRGHLARAHQPAAACSSRHVRRWHLAHGGTPELSNPPPHPQGADGRLRERGLSAAASWGGGFR